MHSYWKDIENETGEWFGLAVDCAHGDGRHRKPALRLESADNGRIRLVQDPTDGGEPMVRLWATILADCYGVHLLRSDLAMAAPVAPSTLDPALVERLAGLPESQRLPAWSRVFAGALSESPASFLHPGLWMFMGLRPRAGGWYFESVKPRLSERRGSIGRLSEPLCEDPVTFLDWGAGGGDRDRILNLRALSSADEGRVKWWRKQAREGALPPVLLWRVDCLQAYLIVDGHCRLQAAVLEDRPPQFLVACSAYEEPVVADPAEQQATLAFVQRHADEVARALPGREPIPTDSLNALLIGAFDDRPRRVPQTYAWASRRPDALWLSEVEARLAVLGRMDLLSEFALR